MKKFLRAFLILMLATFLSACLFACQNNEGEQEHVHSYGEWTVTKEPTCTLPGSRTRACTDGDDTQTEEIPPKGHAIETLAAQDPTCTETGLTEGKKCSVCGEVIVAQKTRAALGHKYGAWTVERVATCNSTGTKKRVCAVCGVEETAEIEKTEHVYGPNGLCRICGAQLSETEGLLFTYHSATDSYVVSGYNGSSPYVVILEWHSDPTYGDKHVTGIAPYAFSDNAELKAVTVPKTVTEIGLAAFSGCVGLEEIAIPNSVSSIGMSAFYGCSSLKSVSIPTGLTAVSYEVFANCSSLTSVVIPSSVTTIGAYAFRGCSSLKSLSLPDSLTGVGDEAFFGCNELEYTEINAGYYLGNESNPYVLFVRAKNTAGSVYEIADGTKIVYSYIFSLSRGFETVIVPASVTYICPNAFSGGAVVKNVLFADGSLLTGIGTSAFSDCGSLVAFNVPAGVTSIGYLAFGNCNALASLTVEDGNVAYYAEDNCIIEKNTKTLVAGCKTSVIPDGKVTAIGDGAFYYCAGLTEIVLPPSVTEIRSVAFSGCENVRRISGSDYVAGIAARQTRAPEYVINVSVGTKVGSRTLKDCKGLIGVEMASSIKAIESNAFEGCVALREIRIPDTVTEVGAHAFEGCKELSVITILGTSVDIAGDAFSGCEKVKNIKLPAAALASVTFRNNLETVEITGGDTIPAAAFNGFENLLSITLPSSIDAIGASAFAGCEKLDAVRISDLSKWCTVAFADSTSNPLFYAEKLFVNGEQLVSLTIPSDVTDLSNYAFYNARTISSLTLPETLVSIGESAFYGCTGFVSATLPTRFLDRLITKKSLKSVTITSGETIADSAFAECDQLTSISFASTVKSIGAYAFEGCSSLRSVTIPSSVLSFHNSAFFGCVGLTEVRIESVEKWCEIDFTNNTANPLYYGKNLYLNGDKVTRLVLSDRVLSVSNYAFYNCTSVTDIKISDAIRSVKAYSFYGTVIQNAELPISVLSYFPKSSWVNVKLTLGEEIPESIFSGCVNMTDVVIPSTVTTIAENAFAGCTGLTSVTLPNSVRTIAASAFVGCDNIKNVSLPTGALNSIVFKSSLETVRITDGEEIIENAFADCMKLTHVEIASTVTTISSKAFSFCSALDDLTIPDSVVSIAPDAFERCTGIKNVTLPLFAVEYLQKGNFEKMTVTKGTEIEDGYFAAIPFLSEVHIEDISVIGKDAFKNCNRLVTVTLAGSVRTIGESAFSGCVSLSSIEIPDGVDVLPENLFYGCASLERVVFGEHSTLTTVEDAVFYNCTSLVEIDIPSTVTALPTGVFFGCSSLETLSLPFVGNDAGGTESSHLGYIFGQIGFSRGVRTAATDRSVLDNPQSTVQPKIYFVPETLRDVTVKQGNIPFGAFENCAMIESVILPTVATKIGAYAFKGCAGIEEILLPAGITEIGKLAFSGSGLTTLTVPSSVVTIGKGALASCAALESLTVPFVGGNKTAAVAGDDTLFCYIFGSEGFDNGVYTEQANEDGSVAAFIPDVLRRVAVTGKGKIFDSAFENCLFLTEIDLNGEIETIEAEAFRNCAGLTQLVLPNDLVFIGDSALEGCEGLTSLIIPDSVASLGEAFCKDCFSLETVTLNAALTSIGPSAFFGCEKLGNVTFPSLVATIENNAFNGCKSITEVVLPPLLTTLSEGLFRNCSALSSFVIPEQVALSSVEKNVFNGCDNLIGTEDENGYYLGQGANDHLILLRVKERAKNFVAHSDVRFVCNAVFGSNSVLESITVPFVGAQEGATSNVTDKYVGYFFSESRIDGFSEIRQANRLTVFVPRSLRKITVLGGVIEDNAFADFQTVTEIVIKEGVTRIGAGAFGGCYGLTDLTLPFIGEEKQTGIIGTAHNVFGHVFGASEFYGSVPVVQTFDSAENSDVRYRIPASLKNLTVSGVGDAYAIPYGGLSGCVTLSRVTLAEKVKAIGADAFFGCTGLLSVRYDGGADDWCRIDFENEASNPVGYAHSLFLYDRAGDHYRPVNDLTVSSAVTKINDNAFYGCENLYEIDLEGVEEIGSKAFYGCTHLRYIGLPTCLTQIGDKTFEKCYRLVEIHNLSAITLVKGSADHAKLAQQAKRIVTESGFVSVVSETEDGYVVYRDGADKYLVDYLGSDKEPTVPADVNKINPYAMYALTDLVSVRFGRGVGSVGAFAFDGCANLSDVKYSGSLKDWLDIEFENESANPLYSAHELKIFDEGAGEYVLLTELTVPAESTEIKDHAFYGCTSLVSANIEDHVLSIGYAAFGGCVHLEEIAVPFVSNPENAFGYHFGRKPYDGVLCNGYYLPESLKKVTVTGGDSIPERAFYECSAIERVILPETILSIGSYAFNGCSALRDLRVPKSLATLGKYVFDGCDDLVCTEVGGGYYLSDTDPVSPNPYYVLVKVGDSFCSIKSSVRVGEDGGTDIDVVYCDCDPFVPGSDETDLSEHSSTEINGDVVASFDVLGEKFASFMSNFNAGEGMHEWRPEVGSTAYEGYGAFSFDVAAILGKANSSLPKGSVTPSLGAFIGVNKTFDILFGEERYIVVKDPQAEDIGSYYESVGGSYRPTADEEIIKSHTYYRVATYADYLKAVAALFGHENAASFATKAQNVAAAFGKVATSDPATLADKLRFDGAFRAENGTFVLPYAFSYATDKENVLYAFVFVSSSDVVVWIGDTGMAIDVANLNEESRSSALTVDVYGRCKLFKTAKKDITEFTVHPETAFVSYGVFNGCASLRKLTMSFVGGNVKAEAMTEEDFFGYVFGDAPFAGSKAIEQKFYLGHESSFTYQVPISLYDLTLKGGVGQGRDVVRKGSFYNCDNVIRLSVENISTIEDYAFYNCYRLIEVFDKTSLNIKNVTDRNQEADGTKAALGYIANYAENIYKDAKNNKVEETADGFIRFRIGGANSTDAILLGYVGQNAELLLDASYVEIYRYAFYGNTDIVRIVIPDTVKAIGSYAFSGCSAIVEWSRKGETTKVNSIDVDNDGHRDVVVNYEESNVLATVLTDGGTFGNVTSQANDSTLASQAGARFGELLKTMKAFLTKFDEEYPGGQQDINGMVEFIIDLYDQNYLKKAETVFTDSFRSVSWKLTSEERIRYGAIGTDYDQYAGAIVGISDALLATFYSEYPNSKISKDRDEYITMLSRLFGYNDPSAFETDLNALAQVMTADTDKTNILKYDGAIYGTYDAGVVMDRDQNYVVNLPAGGGYVLPFAFECDGLNTVLVCILIDDAGRVTAWVSDSITAFRMTKTAAHEEGDAEAIRVIDVYGRNALYNLCTTPLIETIGEAAFAGYKGQRLMLPDTVTSIESYAFDGCDKLVFLRVPEAISKMGEYVFRGCSDIKYSKSDIYRGLYLGNGLNGEVILASSEDSLPPQVDISSQVIFIADNVFQGRTGIEEIVIPATVRSIGKNVFDGCTGLMTVTFEAGSVLTEIGAYAFRNAAELRTIVIPGGVERMGEGMFSGCEKLENLTVPFVGGDKSAKFPTEETLFGYIFGTDNYTNAKKADQKYGSETDKEIGYYIPGPLSTVTVLGGNVLYGGFYNVMKERPAANKEGYELPWTLFVGDDVEGFGENAFYGCDALAQGFSKVDSVDKWIEISFGDPQANPLYWTKDLLVKDGGNYVSVTALDLDASVEEVKAYAFYNCVKISSLSVANSKIRIGSKAFEGCSLGSYFHTYENGKYFGIESNEHALLVELELTDSEKAALTTFTIHPDTQAISEDTFKGCENLRTIALPSGLTTLENSLFYGCSSLENIVIPESVSTIKKDVFYGCTSLSSVTVPASVEDIGERAFYGCSGLTEIVFATGSRLKNISKEAFAFCVNVASLDLPDSLKTIWENAFFGCGGLLTVTLGSGTESIAQDAFKNCASLTGVNYGGNVAGWFAVSFGNEYSNPLYYGHTLSIGGVQVGTITVPAGVRTIGYQFTGCTDLTGIILSSGVEEIGDYAFFGCTNLASVDLGSASALKSIGEYAFAGCNGVGFTALTLPESVIAIGKYAFFGCDKLVNVAFHENCKVTVLSEGIFYGCSGIGSLNINDNVAEIGKNAFYGCSASITWGNTAIVKIGDYAFRGYNGASITVPGSVEEIGEGAFAGCGEITEITLSRNILSIGEGAFSGCDKLERLTLPFVGTSETSDGDAAYFGAVFGKELFIDDNSVVSSAVQVTQKLSYGDARGTVFYIPSTLVSVTVLGGNIAGGAFSACASLRTVTVADDVTSIGASAFWGCTSLTKITLPFVGGAIRTEADTDQYPFGYVFGRSNTNAAVYAEIRQSYRTTLSATASAVYSVPKSLTEVTVTGGNILYGAFYNCSFLTKIVLPDGITDLGERAFFGCAGLTSLEIPSSVTRLGVHLFDGCTNASFDSVVLPAGLTEIGESAFFGSRINKVYYASTVDDWCMIRFADEYSNPLGENGGNLYFSDLTCVRHGTLIATESGYTEIIELVVPEGPNAIGDFAFVNCDRLMSVSIPASVKSVKGYAFRGCAALTSYVVASSDDYKSVDGVLYSADGKKLISYPRAKAGATYVVESSVEEIDDEAFYSCNGLTAVDVGVTGLIRIGKKAFYQCSGLNSLIIPEGVERIEEYAFYSCNDPSLVSLVLPESLQYLGDRAFGSGSFRTVRIGGNDLVMGSNVFDSCADLTSVSIASGVKAVGPYAFSGCNGLSSLTIDEGSVLQTIGNNAFQNCALASVFIPNSVSNIGAYAFGGCALLTEAIFAEAGQDPVELTIGNNAFNSCALTSVVIPDRTASIGSSVFAGCNDLAEITLPFVEDRFGYIFNGGTNNTSNFPSNVTSMTVTITGGNGRNLAANAFNGCNKLVSITIGRNVTGIGNNAFTGCSSLATLTFVEGGSLTTVGNNVFQNCSALASVTIPASVESLGQNVFSGCTDLETVAFEENSALTTIGNSVFQNSAITSVTIPSGVTSIGASAFSGCGDLISVVIPSGVISIGNNAFFDCSSLTSVIVPSSVESIGGAAFSGCGGLASVTFEEGSALSSIGNNAFQGCAFTEIVVPDSVTSIGTSVFFGCNDLAAITLPFVGGNAASSGRFGHIFNGSTNNTTGFPTRVSAMSVTITGGEDDYTLPENAFNGCAKLSDITLGSRVTKIGTRAFQGCSLTSVVVPDTVENIGASAFADCNYLASITLPFVGSGRNTLAVASYFGYIFNGNPTNEIGLPTNVNAMTVTITGGEENYILPENAFSGCVKLSTIVLGESVTGISENAFLGCSGLSEVVFEDSERNLTIWSNAFKDCSSLVSIELPDRLVEIGSSVFSGCGSLSSLTLPFVGDKITSQFATKFGYIFNGGSNDNLTNVPGGLSVKITGGNGEYTLPENAFNGCLGVRKVELGGNVTNIGASAFYGCTGLSAVRFDGGETLRIGRDAFAGCGMISRVEYDGSMNKWCSIDFDSPTSNPLSIGHYLYFKNGVTGEYEDFYLLTISSTVKKYVFYNCYNVVGIVSDTAGVSIGTDAFFGCRSLVAYVSPSASSAIESAMPNRYKWRASSTDQFIKNEQGFILYRYDTTNRILVQYSGAETSITIPSGVTIVNQYAFYQKEIVEVVVPAAVTTIEKYAFAGCADLTSVTFMSSDSDISQTIGSYAFDGCGSLRSVTLSSQLVSVGEYAFRNCFDSASCVGGGISVPAKVVAIGRYAFSGCSYLSSVTFESSNVGLSIGDGAFESCALISVVIPDRTTQIGSSAFAGCSGLTAITLPFVGNVRTSSNAKFGHIFNGNNTDMPSNLTVTVTGGNNAYTLPANAFNGCVGLKNVVLGANVTGIGANAFADCNGLVGLTVSSNLEFLGENAFNNCSSAYSSENATYIDSEHIILKRVTGSQAFAVDARTKFVCGNAFASYEGNTVSYDSMAQWASMEFADATANPLTASSVTVIKAGTATYHVRTATVTFNSNGGSGTPSAVTVDGGSFIAYPTTVPTKSGNVFRGWTTVKDDQSTIFDFSNSVDSDMTLYALWAYIGNNSADILDIRNYNSSAKSYHKATSVTTKYAYFFVPEAVEYRIYYKTAMTTVHVGYKIYNMTQGAYVRGGEYESALCNNTSFEYVAVNDLNVGDVIRVEFSSMTISSFDLYVSWTSGLHTQTSVTASRSLNESDLTGVEKIGSYAFYGFKTLTSVSVPNSVTSIGFSAFGGCDDLATLSLPFVGGSAATNAKFGYIFNGGTSNTTGLPSNVSSMSVTITGGNGGYALPANAFDGCRKLASVTLGSGVVGIGNSAFKNTALTSIAIPGGITSIDSYAFGDCTQLSAVTFAESNVDLTIGSNAFNGCTSLTSVVIPNRTTEIGSSAFAGCNKLSAVTLPFVGNRRTSTNGKFGYIFNGGTNNTTGLPSNVSSMSVTIMGGNGGYTLPANAFDGCWKLASVTLGSGVVGIGNSAFKNTALTSITIPGEIISIGSYAFNNCEQLSAVTFATGSGGLTIGNNAFNGCTSLTSVVIPDRTTQIGASVFAGCKKLAAVTLPFVGNRRTSTNGKFGYIFNGGTSNTTGFPSNVKEMTVTITGGTSEYTIPQNAFESCEKLAKLILGDNVKGVGQSAFRDCYGLYSVELSSAVKTIGSDAFLNCCKLIEIKNLSTISITAGNGGANATYNGIATYAKNVYGRNGTSKLATKNSYYVVYDSSLLISYTGTGTQLSSTALPSGVTSIYRYAFYNAATITSIDIPGRVTSVGTKAFLGCASLTTVYLSDETAVESGAFDGCNVTNVYYNNEKISLTYEKGDAEEHSVSVTEGEATSDPIEFGTFATGNLSEKLVVLKSFGYSKIDVSVAFTAAQSGDPATKSLVLNMSGEEWEEAFDAIGDVTVEYLDLDVDSFGSNACRLCLKASGDAGSGWSGSNWTVTITIRK